MTSRSLADDLNSFIHQHISSIEQLEILLLLKRRASTVWTAASLARELTSSSYSVEVRLFDLMTRHLAVSRPVNGELTFQYHPGPFDDIVARIDREFATRRVSVIKAIFDARPDSQRPLGEVLKLRRQDGAWTALLSATDPRPHVQR